MARHRFSDLTLDEGSSIVSATDDGRSVTLDLVLTRADREQLAGMSAHAGRITEYEPPLRHRLVLDASPDGQNLVAFLPGDDGTAREQVTGGFFLWDAFDAEARGGGARQVASATLRRVTGVRGAQGVLKGTSERRDDF